MLEYESVIFSFSSVTLVISGETYLVTVNFGNKTVYFYPRSGNSYSSKTVSGRLLRRMADDGFCTPPIPAL
ncbi:hypothetical protein [Muribaculum sp.]|uniref:hypothetical protein n=1 Tax=Muribaculum sp. TaxID=1918611 RepID=UPI00257A4C06|nr:hypothetical protein [Muribaculum sp.]